MASAKHHQNPSVRTLELIENLDQLLAGATIPREQEQQLKIAFTALLCEISDEEHERFEFSIDVEDDVDFYEVWLDIRWRGCEADPVARVIRYAGAVTFALEDCQLSDLPESLQAYLKDKIDPYSKP